MPLSIQTGWWRLDISVKKHILICIRSAPHGQAHGRNALDIALTGATFEQNISLLFLDDGIYQLKDQQQPAAIGLKNFAATYKALPLYDINAIYVAIDSLILRQINVQELLLPVQLIEQHAIQALLAQQDTILNF